MEVSTSTRRSSINVAQTTNEDTGNQRQALVKVSSFTNTSTFLLQRRPEDTASSSSPKVDDANDDTSLTCANNIAASQQEFIPQLPSTFKHVDDKDEKVTTATIAQPQSPKSTMFLQRSMSLPPQFSQYSGSSTSATTTATTRRSSSGQVRQLAHLLRNKIPMYAPQDEANFKRRRSTAATQDSDNGSLVFGMGPRLPSLAEQLCWQIPNLKPVITNRKAAIRRAYSDVPVRSTSSASTTNATITTTSETPPPPTDIATRHNQEMTSCFSNLQELVDNFRETGDDQNGPLLAPNHLDVAPSIVVFLDEQEHQLQEQEQEQEQQLLPIDPTTNGKGCHTAEPAANVNLVLAATTPQYSPSLFGDDVIADVSHEAHGRTSVAEAAVACLDDPARPPPLQSAAPVNGDAALCETQKELPLPPARCLSSAPHKSDEENDCLGMSTLIETALMDDSSVSGHGDCPDNNDCLGMSTAIATALRDEGSVSQHSDSPADSDNGDYLGMSTAIETALMDESGISKHGDSSADSSDCLDMSTAIETALMDESNVSEHSDNLADNDNCDCLGMSTAVETALMDESNVSEQSDNKSDCLGMSTAIETALMDESNVSEQSDNPAENTDCLGMSTTIETALMDESNVSEQSNNPVDNTDCLGMSTTIETALMDESNASEQSDNPADTANRESLSGETSGTSGASDDFDDMVAAAMADDDEISGVDEQEEIELLDDEHEATEQPRQLFLAAIAPVVAPYEHSPVVASEANETRYAATDAATDDDATSCSEKHEVVELDDAQQPVGQLLPAVAHEEHSPVADPETNEATCAATDAKVDATINECETSCVEKEIVELDEVQQPALHRPQPFRDDPAQVADVEHSTVTSKTNEATCAAKQAKVIDGDSAAFLFPTAARSERSKGNMSDVLELSRKLLHDLKLMATPSFTSTDVSDNGDDHDVNVVVSIGKEKQAIVLEPATANVSYIAKLQDIVTNCRSNESHHEPLCSCCAQVATLLAELRGLDGMACDPTPPEQLLCSSSPSTVINKRSAGGASSSRGTKTRSLGGSSLDTFLSSPTRKERTAPLPCWFQVDIVPFETYKTLACGPSYHLH